MPPATNQPATGRTSARNGVRRVGRARDEQQTGRHRQLWALATAAEAGMVGALADWFAVTALFKHPLGLPIPHTAIIPTRKDNLGRSLEEFVATNFLAGPVIRDKVVQAQVTRRVGAWVAEPAHAERITAELGALVHGVLAVLTDDDVQDVLENTVLKRLVEPPWGPLAGRLSTVFSSTSWTSSSVSTASTPCTSAPSSAVIRSACAGSATHAPTRRVTCAWTTLSRMTGPARKFVATNSSRLRARLSLRVGMIAVCGMGRPSGCLNSAVTANQSASAPTMPASAAVAR